MFLKRSDPYLLIVGMTGVKMGDRVRAGRLRATADGWPRSPARSACPAARPSSRRTNRPRRARVRPPRMPACSSRLKSRRRPGSRCADDAFDVAVVDDTAGLFGTMRPEGRVAAIRELVRVLRPGGRVLVVGAVPRGGLGARALADAERSAVCRVRRCDKGARGRRVQVGAHAGRAGRSGVCRGNQAARVTVVPAGVQPRSSVLQAISKFDGKTTETYRQEFCPADGSCPWNPDAHTTCIRRSRLPRRPAWPRRTC